jgi:glyoxylase-like metal-dependent hydrolase (beta-lactamase superfamily II)
LTGPTITALDCGWLRTRERTLVDGGSEEELLIPIPAWLVRHRHGDVVFDAGLHPRLAHGSESLGGLAKVFTPDLAESGTVGPRLAEHQVDPTGPLTVVLSHCHFDHVGGLCELPNARVVVHADEWAAATADDHGAYDPSLYVLGHDVLTVDGEHDVFGDGTVTTLPTPGHTCGHQSLRVLTIDGPVILTADACYFTRTLDDGVLPPFGFDLERQRASLDLLRRERAAGSAIVPGHDVEAFRRLLTSAPDDHPSRPPGLA